MISDRAPRAPRAFALTFLAVVAGSASAQEVVIQAEAPPPKEVADDPIRAVLTSVDPDVRIFDEHLTFLANPFLGGRLPGTQGMEIAKDYCEHHLKLAGLEPGFTDESGEPSWRQVFELARRRTLESQSLSVGDLAMVAEEDFQVLSLGASGEASGPATFVGYSIDRGREGYSSYEEGDDLTGKIAVVLRFEPMDESGNSLWATGRSPWSTRASFRRKLGDATDRGAAGILIVSPPGTNDPRASEIGQFSMGRTNADVPVAMVSPDAAQRLFEAAGADFGALAKEANAGRVVTDLDINITLNAGILETPTLGENVGGLIPGRGELAKELIVIGGHLDHLGYGAFGSRDSSENQGNKVHPGADDNATGSAALLMLAERLHRDYNENLPSGADARSILILLFSGEESGLVGSFAYTEDPIVPLEDHALMMNFDMIGRLEGARLNVSGADTGVGMADWAQPFFDSSPLEIVDTFGSRGSSDHAAFRQNRVPVLFGICAELHDDYHTSRDTIATIDRTGAVYAMRLWHSLALSAAVRPERFEFYDENARTLDSEPEETSEAAAPAPGAGRGAPAGSGGSGGSAGAAAVRFGIGPNYDFDGSGVAVGSVSEGTSAGNAGIQAGDVLLTWNGEQLDGAGDMMSRLRDHQPGDRVQLMVRREGQDEPLEVEVELLARDSDG